MRWRTIVLPFTAVLVGLPSIAHAGTDAPVTPYYAPPFADECTVHRFGEGEAPDLSRLPGRPAVRRVRQARHHRRQRRGASRSRSPNPPAWPSPARKCQYWQRDHWSVQFSRGDVPVVRWDGSYWFDEGTGQAAGRLRNLTVGGQPAGIDEAARLVAPVSPELAAYLETYGHGGSGIGADAGVPLNPDCAR